ncbi:unnamed protein product [Callosobruchus maculatus]|uniref:ascorbate ferrireductase (transmembrane) n=1 Tax=Callosobruchus maculatus TaxID=64391 RepID=A0A653DA91_CALMS|nr:unnamed protein product [Callosobruchus maculatus]
MTSPEARRRFFNVSEVVFQQVLAVFVLLILWEVFKFHALASLHTWHIIMCVLGVALCMAEGVQFYRKETIVSFGSTRDSKVLGHGSVMGLAFVMILIGVSLKIQDKIDNGRNHFATTHSKLGLSTWIIAFVAVLGGLVSANSLRFSSIGKPSIIKLVHLSLGVTAYILGVITLGYGISYLGVPENGRIFLIVLLSLYVTYSLLGPCLSVFKFIKG